MLVLSTINSSAAVICQPCLIHSDDSFVAIMHNIRKCFAGNANYMRKNYELLKVVENRIELLSLNPAHNQV